MKKLSFEVFMALVAAAVVTLAARPARADTNFDVSAQTGVSHRFMSGAGGLSGSTGPVLLLEGDLALAPLIRVGAYVDEELAIDGEPKAPFITSFGGRIKVTPPYLQGDKFRFWVFAGFGYSAVVAPAYHQTLPIADPTNPSSVTNADATVPSSGGSFLEIPFGFGASYKLRAPWVFLGELSGRAAFDSTGSYFDPTGRAAYVTSDNSPTGVTIGTESFAVFLTVGVGLEL